MKEIPLSQGYVALIDDEDFEQVSKFNWSASVEPRNVYATTNLRRVGRNARSLKMHRFLIPGVREVLHKDGNGLNNRRENLMSGTHQQNCWGPQAKRLGTSSKFRGVSLFRRDDKWQAKITVSRKQIHLGFFDTQEEAAIAYDSAAIRFFGEFACPNFPQFQFMSGEDEIKDSIDDTGN